MSDAMAPDHARLVALVVAVAFFMEFLDGTVIATALPAMAAEWHRAAVELSIGISAYLLCLAVFIPVSGWIADRFGTRDVFTTAVAVFTLASLLCGLSTGLWSFVAARVLQGLGGALMVPVGRMTVLRTTEKSRIVGAIALLTWPALAAPVLGAPIGGLLTSYASWRWIFLLNVPTGLATMALAWRLMPNLHSPERRPFDLPGFLCGGIALALVMEGLELVSADRLDWAAGLLATGLALGAAAVRHARRTAHPVLDLSVLRVPSFAATITGGTVFRTAISTAPFLLPLFFQLGWGLDAFHAGLLVLVTFAGNVGMKPMTTSILRRWGFRRVALVTGVAASAALAACALLSPGTPLALVLPVLFAGGMARSMQFTVLNTLAFADVAPARMSSASSLASVAMQMSIGMGVALGAALLHLVARNAGHAPPSLGDFHLVFVLVALFVLAGLPAFLRLPAAVGAEVSGHRRAGG